MTTSVPGVGVVRTPRHLYYFNGNGPWPGVTTVTDVLDKPALVEWKRKQIAEAALAHAGRLVEDKEAGNDDAAISFLLKARDEGTTGRDRGTRLHTTLEAILRREGVAVDPRDEAAVAGARAWLNETKVKPIEIEFFVINETLGYGGTGDLIAVIAGEVWLLDWKSSKSVADARGRLYSDHRLQLAGYAGAEFIARPGDANRYEIPHIDRFGIVHVTDAGTRLYEANVTGDDWIAFRACLRLHQWRANGSRRAA
jgi:hypothetical protein